MRIDEKIYKAIRRRWRGEPTSRYQLLLESEDPCIEHVRDWGNRLMCKHFEDMWPEHWPCNNCPAHRARDFKQFTRELDESIKQTRE